MKLTKRVLDFPGGNRSACPAWRPGMGLSQLEEEMVTAAACGILVSRGEGPFELPEMKAWDKARTIRAEVLRYLLVEDR